MLRDVTASEQRVIAIAFGITCLAGVLRWVEAAPVLVFATSTMALTAIAYLIGEATNQLGNHLGASATGMVQSALGNLPEVFVCIFALRAGSVEVVQAALVGSILATAVLILGVALVVGSERHGLLKFESRTPRMISVLLLLAVSALVLPTLAHELHLPAAQHQQELAVVCAVALLLVFALSTRLMLRGGERKVPPEARARTNVWPVSLAVLLLAVCGVTTVLLADWFIEALKPATERLGISEAFAGLVIVAIASNTVGIVEIRLAFQGRADLAVSVALNGALQVAVAVIPFLVLVSFIFFDDTPFTLAIPPIMAIALTLAVLVVTLVCVDGRADTVDGAALVGLYILIAAIFWWG
ncbi:MAG TPA: sodium:proton exchanger [Rhizobiaceae bacterium]|nr:sodium:proton exchanger [Rhizobiaceae bacterium]